MKTKKLVFISILVAQALVLFIVESMIPVPFIAPGAKLGLSNIITVVSLYTFGLGDTLLIILLRIFLSTLFTGSVVTLLYSILGGIFSVFAMFLIKKIGKDKVSLLGVSIIGAIFHNIGQITAASIVISNINIFLYLPVLFFVSIGTGLFVGAVSKYLLIHFKKINLFNNM